MAVSQENLQSDHGSERVNTITYYVFVPFLLTRSLLQTVGDPIWVFLIAHYLSLIGIK